MASSSPPKHIFFFVLVLLYQLPITDSISSLPIHVDSFLDGLFLLCFWAYVSNQPGRASADDDDDDDDDTNILVEDNELEISEKVSMPHKCGEPVQLSPEPVPAAHEPLDNLPNEAPHVPAGPPHSVLIYMDPPIFPRPITTRERVDLMLRGPLVRQKEWVRILPVTKRHQYRETMDDRRARLMRTLMDWVAFKSSYPSWIMHAFEILPERLRFWLGEPLPPWHELSDAFCFR